MNDKQKIEQASQLALETYMFWHKSQIDLDIALIASATLLETILQQIKDQCDEETYATCVDTVEKIIDDHRVKIIN